MLQFIVLIFISCFSFSALAESKCEEDHTEALKTCSAHKHNVTGDQLEGLSAKTRTRAAEKEANKLFNMGKSCAKAQEICKESCTTALSSKNKSMQFTQIIDWQSNCSEGLVAKERSIIAKKYLKMKSIIDMDSRKPSNR